METKMSEKGKPPETERSPWAPPEGWQPEIREVPEEKPAEVRAGKVIPLEDFKGDPRRVPGHPSNPATPMLEAFAHPDPEAMGPAEQPHVQQVEHDQAEHKTDEEQ